MAEPIQACYVCGNAYDKAFQVVMRGTTYVFDSFECAIHALAPTCVHCRCRIIGHGVEVDGNFFCCVHCARNEGVSGLEDRLRTEQPAHIKPAT